MHSRTVSRALSTLGFLALCVSSSAAADPAQRAKNILTTDKGCIAYHYTPGPMSVRFEGACVAAKPINGKGVLSIGRQSISGTWVNGIIDGAATTTDGSKTPPLVRQVVYQMGCYVQQDGKPVTQAGCKEAMAKPIAAATPKPPAVAASTPAPAPTEQQGRAERTLTDKGCIAYVYNTTNPFPSELRLQFSAACTAGKPVGGKGTLAFPGTQITGTWVNGVANGPFTIEQEVTDEKSVTKIEKSQVVYEMGCQISLNGKPTPQPGCKEAMEKRK